jgi:hypothetical protein
LAALEPRLRIGDLQRDVALTSLTPSRYAYPVEIGVPMKRFFLVILVGFLGMNPASLRAHHSFSAEYDETHPVKVSGVVTKVEWQNPHIWYYVDVKGADGKVTKWGFSGGAPGQLMRRGITKDAIQPGMLVTVEGFRAKDGSNNGFGQQVTFPSQRSVVTGTPAEQASEKGHN